MVLPLVWRDVPLVPMDVPLVPMDVPVTVPLAEAEVPMPEPTPPVVAELPPVVAAPKVWPNWSASRGSDEQAMNSAKPAPGSSAVIALAMGLYFVGLGNSRDVALSTYLPLADQLAQERSDANRELPIFMAHGSQDPVVAESLGSMSRDRMRSLGYVIDWHSYPMPHAVCPAEIGDIADWLQKRLTS